LPWLLPEVRQRDLEQEAEMNDFDLVEWLNKQAYERIERDLESRKANPKQYIDPLNPYTGEVSVMQIFRNMRNGHTKFPGGMGDVK
jgi:hypothetical protein